MPRILSRPLLAPVLLVLVLLAGCTSRSEPTATGRAGGQTERTEAAACRRNCDRGYDVCSESGAARIGSGMFSGSASCDRELRQCRAGCSPAP